jgi:hypothetical protein
VVEERGWRRRGDDDGVERWWQRLGAVRVVACSGLVPVVAAAPVVEVRVGGFGGNHCRRL